MLVIKTIKSKEGLYLNSSSFGYNKPIYKFNGKLVEFTWKQGWYFLEDELEIKSITQEILGTDINRRYELKDEFRLLNKFKEIYLLEETRIYDEDDEEYVFTQEFEEIKGLYLYKSDKVPSFDKELEFKEVLLFELDFKKPNKLEYLIQKTKWRSEGLTNVPESEIQLINKVEEIFIPPLIHHTRPCKIDSLTSYKIIREHIKNNIDPKISTITSDYDFCFVVSKKILLNKPYEKEFDISKFGSKKPKYETRMILNKSIPIFSIKSDLKQNYNYELAPVFEGSNQEELDKNIKDYLEHLILVINEPLKECNCCNGVGVLINNK